MKASIETLDYLIGAKPRSQRLTKFIRDPAAKETPKWYMCVPYFFNLSLDIKVTDRMVNKIPIPTLTQGSAFAFNKGDIIYDTPSAYTIWSNALKAIYLAIHVISSTPSIPTKRITDENDKQIIIPRNPGKVHFSIYRPNIDKTRILKIGEHQLTQDDFLRFMIAGPDPILRSVINEKSLILGEGNAYANHRQNDKN